MKNKPFILLKAALSWDGYLSHSAPERLILSSPEDLSAVDQLRSEFDAIWVGAQTVRADHPSLLIRSQAHRNSRIQQGLSEHPVKITWTFSGNLDANSRFFELGEGPKWVYCPADRAPSLQVKLGGRAQVMGFDATCAPVEQVLEDLSKRGIRRLLVEGGGRTHDLFLRSGSVDAIRLAWAPLWLGEQGRVPFLLSTMGLQQQDWTLDHVEKQGTTVVAYYQRVRKPEQ